MNPRKGLVLDANILMRAVLGRRVLELLQTYEDVASFYSPDVCFADARRYLEKELQKRGRDTATGLAALDQLSGTVQVVDRTLYGDFEQLARESASKFVIRTIGPSWRWRYFWTCRFEPRTRTFSAAVWRPGRQTE